MSSHEFLAVLLPEVGLRCAVRLSGIAATTIGMALILQMPLGAIERTGLAILWLFLNGRELLALASLSNRVSKIGFSKLGEVWVVDSAGQKVPVTLLRGSVVLSRFAWLRIRFADGRKYAELVRGNAVKDRQWHRFQLIWKQARQIIGRAG